MADGQANFVLHVTKYCVSVVLNFHEQLILNWIKIIQNSIKEGSKNNANSFVHFGIPKSRKIGPWSAQWSNRRSRTIKTWCDLAPKGPLRRERVITHASRPKCPANSRRMLHVLWCIFIYIVDLCAMPVLDVNLIWKLMELPRTRTLYDQCNKYVS